jgi:hypothetical protein
MKTFHFARLFGAIMPPIIALVSPLACAESSQQKEPDYLMPISPDRRYEASVEKLLANKWGGGTMIYHNNVNHEGDFVVSLWGSDNKPKTLTLIFLVRKKEWSAEAKSQIDVPIDTNFADAIYKAWCAMLLKTRYPDKIPVYADGWTAEFSAWVFGAGAAYGTGTPVAGFQKELMDFGFQLKDYCTASEADRKVKHDALIPRMKDFTTRVERSHLY